MSDRTLLSPHDTDAELAGTAFRHEPGHLEASYKTSDFVDAVRLLDAITVVAEESNHHPDVRLGWGRITFELSSHDAGGVTSRDVRLARRIDELAAAHGARRA